MQEINYKELRREPHPYQVCMTMQYSFSSAVAQIRQKVLVAGIFQAMLADLSAAASFVYQSPMHMPETNSKIQNMKKY